MKKYFMVFAASLALCTSAQALKTEEYESSLDEWQKIYPIIKKVRKDSQFQSASKEALKLQSDDKDATSLTVFKSVLKLYIGHYLKDISKYYSFVEGLDPVYRDAFGLEGMPCSLPTIGENIYNVHRIFGSVSDKA